METRRVGAAAASASVERSRDTLPVAAAATPRAGRTSSPSTCSRGAWIVQGGLAIGMPPLRILLCLPFELMPAPVGPPLYFALRFLVR